MQAHLTSLQWCHVQLEKLARSRIQAWQVEQTKIVSELLMAADALVVIDKITAAVQDQLALVDLQGSWMMRGVPMHKIETPPFYAAWATPILHDSLTGLRTDTHAQVIDTRGEVIAGLYCAGESQGGFAQHGLARCIVFGRIAGRHAAKNSA